MSISGTVSPISIGSQMDSVQPPSLCLKVLSKICCIALAAILTFSACVGLGWISASPLLVTGLLLVTPALAYAGRKLDQSIVSIDDQGVLLPQIDGLTQVVRKLEERSLELRESGDSDGAMAVWEQSLAIDQQAREFNSKSTSFTRYDLLSMKRIFEPPINEYHIDKDRTRYYAPDHSEILKFIESYRVAGGYVGYGMNPRNKAMDPVTGKLRLCDFIYLTKDADQITFEKEVSLSRTTGSWLFGPSRIPERQRTQERISNQEFLPFLKENINRWKYDGYLLCLTPKDFENLMGTLEFSSDQLYKTHAVTLFYKEAPEKEGL